MKMTTFIITLSIGAALVYMVAANTSNANNGTGFADNSMNSEYYNRENTNRWMDTNSANQINGSNPGTSTSEIRPTNLDSNTRDGLNTSSTNRDSFDSLTDNNLENDSSINADSSRINTTGSSRSTTGGSSAATASDFNSGFTTGNSPSTTGSQGT